MTKGLYDKYRVEKVDKPTDADAQYFVLRVDTDPHARAALRAYADSLESAGENKLLVSDIREWLRDLEDDDAN
ncbi:MAG: hypothetical protein ACYTEQ_06625 [Planctomycetota bacterium]|jgi:hypothetical protein